MTLMKLSFAMAEFAYQLCFATLSVCVTTPEVHAQLIAYEPFDYDAGDLLAVAGGDLGGGVGWANINTGGDGWVVGSALPYDPDRVRIEDTPTGWGYIDSLGNSLSTTGRVVNVTHWEQVNRYIDLTAIDPSLLNSNGEFGADGSEIWISFLGQGTEIHRAATLDLGGVYGPFGFDRAVALGRPFALQPDGSQEIISPSTGFNRAWSILDKGAAPGSVAATGNSYDEKVFFVARINFDGARNAFGDETITTWINPELGDTAPSDASAKINDFVAYDFALSGISFIGIAETYFDEIRIGLSYGDVAPIAVPEPASLSLATSLALALTCKLRHWASGGP